MKKLLILITCFIAFPVFSHPHSFIDLQTQIRMEKHHLQGFSVQWTLDEIASSELIYELKTAPDREAAERSISEELAQTALNNHYFSYLYDEQNQPIKFSATPLMPSIRIQGAQVIFSMRFNVAKPYDMRGKYVNFYTYEPSYYIGMEYNSENDVQIDDSNCAVALHQPQASQALRLYAANLDKNEQPDMPADEASSLGAQFAQKVSIQCQ